MVDTNEMLKAYMTDDPNLITQSEATESGMNSLQREDAQPSQDDTQGTVTGSNATPDTTSAVAEGREHNMEVTNLQERPSEVVANIGTVLGGLIPTTWFVLRLEAKNRKRKERSPSLVASTDGGDQSADVAGAHKKPRATTGTVRAPAEEAENGAVDSCDSRPSRSGSEAPQQSLNSQAMPGALSLTSASSQSVASTDSLPTSLTGGDAHLTGSEASITAAPPCLTLVVANNNNASGPVHASPASGVTESSGRHGPPATTTTPPNSPPRVTAEARLIPVKDKTPSHNLLSPIDRPLKNLPSTVRARTALLHGPGSGASADGSQHPPVGASTNASEAPSSTTPNSTDLWAILAQQFDGVRTEIQSMGIHMRTMNSNIGRLDNTMGIMTEQHTELMSVLRASFTASNQPHARHQTSPAGQPPAPGQPPASHRPATGPHSAAPVPVVRRPAASIAPPTPSSSSSCNHPPRAQAPDDDQMDVDEGDVADGEGEISEPLPVLVKASKLKLKGMPKTRDPVRKALLDNIALVARKYMGREPDLDDDDDDCDVLFFDKTKVPSRKEVDAFTGQAGQCCTIDNFRPDLIGTPRSIWNQSAAQVFVKEYVKMMTAKSKNVAEVQRAFGVHIKTLINSFKTFQASHTENDAKRRKRRQYMRKSYAHERCMLTIASHDGLKRHLWIIQALGVQGMSSDESEHEGTQVRYRRTTLAWRNPALETFLRVIDVFHDASRFTNSIAKSSKSGAHVHMRLPTQKISERAAVPGLPLAAYDPAWLKGLSEFFCNQLNISDVQYHFQHPPEIMKEMMEVLRPLPSDQTKQTIPPPQ